MHPETNPPHLMFLLNNAVFLEVPTNQCFTRSLFSQQQEYREACVSDYKVSQPFASNERLGLEILPWLCQIQVRCYRTKIWTTIQSDRYLLDHRLTPASDENQSIPHNQRFRTLRAGREIRDYDNYWNKANSNEFQELRDDHAIVFWTS